MVTDLTRDEQRRKMLAEFLRSRRARLTPEQVGITGGRRRRTPGLRREEVAELAGVSTDWYTWLEQGRDIQVSSGVIDAIARALRLSRDEQLHLMVLTAPAGTLTTFFSRNTDLERYQQFVTLLDELPAHVIDRRMDFIAWNRAARVTFGYDAGREHNMLRLFFLDDAFRRRMLDWERDARGIVAAFRMTVARHLDDPDLLALVQELTEQSAEFRQFWGEYEVRSLCGPYRVIDHPIAGRMTFDQLSFQVGGDPDIHCCMYKPADVSTAAKLRALLKPDGEMPSLKDDSDGVLDRVSVEAGILSLSGWQR